jgi:hypothetical protein
VCHKDDFYVVISIFLLPEYCTKNCQDQDVSFWLPLAPKSACFVVYFSDLKTYTASRRFAWMLCLILGISLLLDVAQAATYTIPTPEPNF